MEEKFLIRLLTVENDELTSCVVSAKNREDAMRQVAQKAELNSKFRVLFNAAYDFKCTKSDDVFLKEEMDYSKASYMEAGISIGLSRKQTEVQWLKTKGLSIVNIALRLVIEPSSVMDRITKSKFVLDLDHNREINLVIVAEIKKISRLKNKS